MTATIDLRKQPGNVFLERSNDLCALRPELIAEARSITKRSDVAEDVVQDVYTRLWEGRIAFDGRRGSLRGWLRVVTRNAAIDAARREGLQIRNALIASAMVSTLPVPEDSVAKLDHMADVETLLGQLPSEQREVIELTFYGGLTHVLIAERLQAPLGTVKSRIRRGLNTMAALHREPAG